MTSDWQTYILKELAADSPNAMSTGPFGSAISAKYFTETGVPVIRGGNLSIDVSLKMSDDGLVFINSEKAKEFGRSVVKRGDLIFTCWGTINQVGLITDNLKYKEYIISNKQMKFSPHTSKVDSLFLYYLFSSPIKQAEILQNGIGAAVPGFNLGQLKQHLVSLPPLKEQKAIAHILGSLDDKIELNRQMNATLEAMAQALFKSWFVDFDPVIDNALAAGNPIPDELEAKAAARQALGDARKPLPEDIRSLFPNAFVFTEEMGWIPEGWNIGEVGGILDRLTIKKRYKKNDVLQHGKIPVYEQGANILLGYHQGQAEIESDIENPAFIFGDHTCVTKLSCEPFSISENVIPLRGKKYPTAWVYFAIQDKQNFEEYRRHWMELVVKTTILPEYKPTQCFVENINGFLQKQIAIVRENSSLEQLRDTLLPKLLSGELRIPEAERLVEEAIA